MKTIYALIIVLWASVLIGCNGDCCDEVTVAEKPVIDTTMTKIKSDSLFKIADQLVDEIYIEQTTYDNKIHSQELTIEDKAARLNSALIEVNESHIKLEQEIAKAALAKEMAIRAKTEFEAEIDNLHEAQKSLTATNKSIEIERQLLITERNKLKAECQRLNSLLGNDYNTIELDSIIELPDSLKIDKKTRNKKKRKGNGK